MNALKQVLVTQGANIAESEWSAKLSSEEQIKEVQKIINKVCNQNFIVFTEGSVIPEGKAGIEHMWSFDYAYRLEAVRDWLFQQVK